MKNLRMGNVLILLLLVATITAICSYFYIEHEKSTIQQKVIAITAEERLDHLYSHSITIWYNPYTKAYQNDFKKSVWDSIEPLYRLTTSYNDYSVTDVGIAENIKKIKCQRYNEIKKQYNDKLALDKRIELSRKKAEVKAKREEANQEKILKELNKSCE